MDETDETNDTNEMMMMDNEPFQLELNLGDIIQIISPTNADMNEETYYIYYIDATKVKIANIRTQLLHELKIDETTRSFTDESITEIYLLSRAEHPGYIAQNELSVNQWVDIHFGGEMPTILTGVITNIEEDMIELTTWTDKHVIYIDFEYKGIPENIPIQKIVKRDEPSGYKNYDADGENGAVAEEDGEGAADADTFEPTIEFNEKGETVIHAPPGLSPLEINFREDLHKLYSVSSTPSSEFGEELEDVYQQVEIPEQERRYGIDAQLNDMVDHLLSTIPTAERTPAVLQKIHQVVSRFRELRTLFSTFNADHHSIEKKTNGSLHKPLLEQIANLNTKLHWFLPVVKINNILYEEKETGTLANLEIVSYAKDLTDLRNAQEQYYKNIIPPPVAGRGSKYQTFLENMDEFVKINGTAPPRSMNDILLFENDVQTDLEGIIGNYDNFTSHNCCVKNDIAKTRFVIQRYNLERRPPHKTDKITVKSFIVMPRPVIQWSRINLPRASILTRSRLNQTPFYPFRFFQMIQRNPDKIITHTVEDMQHELFVGGGAAAPRGGNDSAPRFIQESAIQELTLAPGAAASLREMLQVVLPSTKVLLENMKSLLTTYSIESCLQEMEPFNVQYENLHLDTYNHIYSIIKENRMRYKTDLLTKKTECAKWKHVKFTDNAVLPTAIDKMMKMNVDIYNVFLEYLDDVSGDAAAPTALKPTNGELLCRMLSNDTAVLFHRLLTTMMMSLMTPDKLMELFGESAAPLELDDDGDTPPRNKCVRRFLTKEYSTMEKMQNDNGTDAVFYDKEHDDTPYDIIKKYSNEKKTMLAEKFKEFLKENLVQRHNCPREMADELADALIEGKKRVREGEYAILKMVPSVLKGVEVGKMNPEEKETMDFEQKLKTKIYYYRRIKDQWVKDNDIEPEAFLDTNALFCNIAPDCHKNQTTNTCDTLDAMKANKHRLDNADIKDQTQRSYDEFHKRYSQSLEEMKMNFEKENLNCFKRQNRMKILKKIDLFRNNFNAYKLGKQAISTDDLVVSPHYKMLQHILSQPDFAKKQTDICRFHAEYCRQPLTDATVIGGGENPHWAYCVDSNIQLLPLSIYQLAQAFMNGEYSAKLPSICRMFGKLSDDGDSIVDKYSGMVLRKIDFLDEYGGGGASGDGEDGAGEDDVGVKIAELLNEVAMTPAAAAGNKKTRLPNIYEDQTTQTIYNILLILCTNMKIKDDAVLEQSMRLCISIIPAKDFLMNKAAYEKMKSKPLKENALPLPSYEIYKNQNIITLAGAVLLIAVQCTIPFLKITGGIGGKCVKSFVGFPTLGGENETDGIKYIACVIQKTKSSVAPWDSIQNISASSLEKRMFQLIKRVVLSNAEIDALMSKKREYAALHANLHDETIPSALSLQKWVSFAPPIVPFHIDNLTPLGKEFIEQTRDAIKSGARIQHEMIHTISVKTTKNVLGIVECINRIVVSKDTLLKTMSSVPFLENACCNESRSIHPLNYFMGEDKEIKLLLLRGADNIQHLQHINQLSKANIYYCPENTKQPPIIVATNETDTGEIYKAFVHYLNLDNNRLIPEDLQVLFKEKPATEAQGYKAEWNDDDKMNFLKMKGKKWTARDLNHLMKIVHSRSLNKLSPETTTESSVILLNDVLPFLEQKQSPVISQTLIAKLESLLREYIKSPRKLRKTGVDEMDPFMTATQKLREHLISTNQIMMNEIIEFFRKGKQVSDREFNEYQEFISRIVEWEITDASRLNDIFQFVKTSIYQMIDLFPGMILHKTSFVRVPTHKWGLSSTHVENLMKKMKEETATLVPFQNDSSIDSYLRTLEEWNADVGLFMKYFPLEIESADHEYRLFNYDTVCLLMKYIWYSVLLQLVQSADNPELVQIDIQTRTKYRRAQMAENDEEFFRGEATDDDEDDEMQNVEIQLGNLQELKTKVHSLLGVYLKIDMENKKLFNKKYETISKKVGISKQQEKKSITDFFESKDNDERRVEKMLEQYKIGRWNAGKGIYKYDKQMYDEEQETNMARMYDEFQRGDELPGGGVAEGADEDTGEPAAAMNDFDAANQDGYVDFNELSEEYDENYGGGDEQFEEKDYY